MALVVVGLEVGDGDLCVQEGEPLVHVQAFLPDTAVERLDEGVAPGFSGRDVTNVDLPLTELAEGIGNQFGAVIATDRYRYASQGDEVFDDLDNVSAGNRPGRQVEQRFAGVLIDHRRDLELATIMKTVVLEIDSPHNVRRVCVDDRPSRFPDSFTTFAAGDLEAFPPPNAVYSLLVDFIALSA